jgi:CARDB
MLRKATLGSVVVIAICLITLNSWAECIRSCTANLYVELTSQPEGQTSVQKKTGWLKTQVSAQRDGRYGGSCVASGIIKAKKRGCTEAVQALMREYRSPDKQRQALCQAVQLSSETFERAQAGNERFPGAAWYRIDHMKAVGKRDLVTMKGDVENIDHSRFSCDNGRARLSAAGAPPPPPTAPSGSARPAPAPAPPSGSSGSAAPAPPPSPPTGQRTGSASTGAPDLYISAFGMTPETPIKGQPVQVRITVYNKGTQHAGPFKVAWYAGENYPQPACRWDLPKLNARGGRILTQVRQISFIYTDFGPNFTIVAL